LSWGIKKKTGKASMRFLRKLLPKTARWGGGGTSSGNRKALGRKSLRKWCGNVGSFYRKNFCITLLIDLGGCDVEVAKQPPATEAEPRHYEGRLLLKTRIEIGARRTRLRWDKERKCLRCAINATRILISWSGPEKTREREPFTRSD